jgi:hypothetical protein
MDKDWMNVEVGEVWRWVEENPLLLLLREEENDGGIFFLCLDLTTEEKFSMVFHPALMDRWTRLA